jgi:tRNA pseudouridine38-40 synthase
MRYFTEVSYDGTDYCGWQYQKNTVTTVQETIEQGMKRLLKNDFPLVGCGRTDTGVHARGYWFHFNSQEALDTDWVVDKLNHVLPKSIATHRIVEVDDKAHARFDAYERSYIYRLRIEPDPFDYRFTWYHRFQTLNLDILNATTAILLDYEDFFPFCKLGSDVKTYKCKLTKAEWTYDNVKRVYELRITSNRFLRGMIRLIVGVCINVHKGSITLKTLRDVMDHQSRLPIDHVVPASGLTLYGIKYPYISTSEWDKAI